MPAAPFLRTKRPNHPAPGRQPRPRAWQVLVSVAALQCALAGPASAQSLVQVYEAAHDYDAAYLAVRSQAESAEFAAAQAEALRRPSAGLVAGVNRSQIDSSRLGSGSTTTREANINARQSLYNRASSSTIDQAYRSLDIARASLQAAEQDLLVRATQAYFDVLASQDTVAFAQTNRTAISEQLAAAKRNFEVGTATITDTREAQARSDLATAQEIAAENELRTRQAALDQLVGRSGVAPKPLATPVKLPELVGSVDDWLAQTETEHPLIRQAQLGLDIAQLETEKARAGHLPTVDLVGSVGTGRDTGRFATSPGTTSQATVGVELNLPLFSGFAVQNRIKETLALEERARNDLDGARRSVHLGTRQAFLAVQSGVAQVQALEAAESSSLLALESTQLGYRVGVRVNLDVLNAQTQLFQTRRDLARARYDVLVGTLQLRQAVGRLTPADLQAVEALLAR